MDYQKNKNVWTITVAAFLCLFFSTFGCSLYLYGIRLYEISGMNCPVCGDA